MKVLLDESVPKALKTYLLANGHQCSTVQEEAWSGKQNGELLGLVEGTFDVLITVDTNLSYQQDLAGHKIAVVILQCSTNRLDHLRQFFPACLSALTRIQGGEIILIGDRS